MERTETRSSNLKTTITQKHTISTQTVISFEKTRIHRKNGKSLEETSANVKKTQNEILKTKKAPL